MIIQLLILIHNIDKERDIIFGPSESELFLINFQNSNNTAESPLHFREHFGLLKMYVLNRLILGILT